MIYMIYMIYMQLETPSEVAIAVRITNPSVFIGRTFFDGEFQIRQDAWRGWVEKQAWVLFSRMGNNIQRHHVLVDM